MDKKKEPKFLAVGAATSTVPSKKEAHRTLNLYWTTKQKPIPQGDLLRIGCEAGNNLVDTETPFGKVTRLHIGEENRVSFQEVEN